MRRSTLVFAVFMLSLPATSTFAQIETSPWSALGGGLFSLATGVSYSVSTLEVFDDGQGPALYAGGILTALNDDGAPSQGLARWDGAKWSGLGDGLRGLFIAAATVARSFDDGSGARLYVGGTFQTAGNLYSPGFARFGPAGWEPIGAGNGAVGVLAVADTGGGSTLHAAGAFSVLGTSAVNNIARLQGGVWVDLGQGILPGPGPSSFPALLSIAVFDDGSGPALHLGGHFRVAGEGPGDGIARWNGQGWSLVGGGCSGLNTMYYPFTGPQVSSIAVFDDGSGPALFATGGFTHAGGTPAPGIAKWDGQAWHAVGASFVPASSGNTQTRILGSFDDGIRPKLMVTTTSPQVGATPVVHGLAIWDGISWSSPAGGFNGAYASMVYSTMTTWDDGAGSGPAVLLAGSLPAGVDVLRIRGFTPSVRASQPAGSGGEVWLSNFNLTPGHAYRNLFSLTPSLAGMPGPFLGLSFADPGALIVQLVLPPGTPPFTFSAASGYAVWGPLLHPPASIEAVCADVTGGALGAYSAPVTIVVQ